MYHVDKAVIAKESDIFKKVPKNTDQLILDETKTSTLETFLTYCYSGYIPNSSVDKDLATFVEKYNVTNLKDLMDRYLSLTLTGKNAKNWIPWAIKLKMENTALRLGFCEKEIFQSLNFSLTRETYKKRNKAVSK